MRRAILIGVAAIASATALVVTWRRNERAAGLDFYVYYFNARLVERGYVGNIYDPDVQSRFGEEEYARAQASDSELWKFDASRRRFPDSVSSPFLYTALGWVSRDYERALTEDHLLVLAALIGGMLLIARAVGLSWSSALFLLAAVLLFYRGLEADLRVGNVNSLQLFAIGASLWAPPLWAGALLGLLLAFKPNLLFVVILLVVARLASRDWRRLWLELSGGAAGVVVAIVAAAVHYGSLSVWIDWIAAANRFWHRLPSRMDRNLTPALPLFVEHGAWLSSAIALMLLALAAAAIWKGARQSRDWMATRECAALVLGLGILVYLLSATVVWLHYMVLVLPIAIALLRWRTTAIIALVALAVIAEEPFEMITRRPAAPIEVMLIAPALVVLFLCAIWKVSHLDPTPA
jgi:4-amino-4-deoxy-L-arabinose transferase-like glycosyltransferase